MDIQKTQLDKHLERLIQKEKNARINNQHAMSVNILKEIIGLCYKAQNYDKLKDMIKFLMDRRGQSKKAQIEMIQLAMSWLSQTPQPYRTQLILTIRDVTAKKIYLEVQYARCVLMIVKGKQDDNDILQAAKILQEVQVQTYGSMDRRQKLEFILYQMKIMLKKQDYIRLYIISKKINQNNLNDDQIADIKINYYAYMAMYHIHQHNYLNAAKCYQTLWETLLKTKKIIPQVLDFGFQAQLYTVASNYIGFLVLHPYSQQTQKQLINLSLDERLQKYQHIQNLLKNFLSQQLISSNINDYQLNDFQLFTDKFTNSKNHQQQLKRMLVQHNIRIISKYYSRITLSRIQQLNKIDKDYCQEQLCTLNNKKVISCRVDRIDDIVDFRPVQHEEHIVKTWNASINGILDLVDAAANLIHRQRQVYKK